MTQKGRLLQDLARSTLLQALHPLTERPEPALQLRAHGALGEPEVLGDLLRAQPLLEAQCYSRPVLVR